MDSAPRAKQVMVSITADLKGDSEEVVRARRGGGNDTAPRFSALHPHQWRTG